MAITGGSGSGKGPLGLDLVPQKYVSLGQLIDPTKPDNRDILIKTFGDQGITGFLELTGATKNAGTSDEVQYWEEGRLNRTMSISIAAAGGDPDFTATCTIATVDNGTSVSGSADKYIRPNDVLLLSNGERLFVQTVSDSALTFEANLLAANGAPTVVAAGSEVQANLIGNMYAQGTGQPTKFFQTSVTKRVNPYIISKETFHVNGSQATNIGWINVGNGDYRWYVKGEMDTRKRFMNQRESMMMYSQLIDNSNDGVNDSVNGVVGSEGYFAAIENRGLVAAGADASFDDSGASFTDMDAIILALDKEGAPAEYAMYVDRATSIALDDMLAGGPVGSNVSAGLPGQFGSFANSADMAIQLGFKSFTRGGYTFHKHDWKLLNDPTYGGSFAGGTAGAVKGVMCPMTQVTDAKTGTKAPALEMNYKAANGYSRDMEHWVEGGGVLGFATNDQDVAKFHYRSETNLVTRAANQHVLLKY